MVFIFTGLCNHHHLQFQHFYHPKKKFHVLPFPLPPALATTNQLSVSINLPILDISDKWNRTLCSCFDCLLSFSIMYSRCIYVAARISASFLFIAKIYSIALISHRLVIHSFINGWTCILNRLLFVAFEKESCVHLCPGITPTAFQLSWQIHLHLILGHLTGQS